VQSADIKYEELFRKTEARHTFDKFKARVLFCGDLQRAVGQSKEPVRRIESLKTIMIIAAFKDYEIFTVNVMGAYLNMPMPTDVKDKWMKLDKDVVDTFLEIDRESYLPYVHTDGTMMVCKKKLMYGYQKAAHYWHNEMDKVFTGNGCRKCKKDKCVFVKKKADKQAICGITVDDGFYSATRDDKWIAQQVEMLR
jgi:hypothetical protein